MRINDVEFGVSVNEIVSELASQLHLNNIPLLNTIKDSPDNVMVSCVFHKNGQERRPSAGIRKSDGMYHCFACGETHTLPEVVSYCFNKDDMLGTFGWNWLLRNFLTVSVEERKSFNLDIDRNKIVQSKNYVLEEELDKYRYYHPYMYKRKLNDEVIDIFDIGYDSVSECITFPIRDIDGKCLFVAKRSVKTKFFNYPNGVDKPVYGLFEIGRLKQYPKEVIICESMLDALVCWVWGKYAVALNGLGNELQFKQLNSMPCRKFILATDNDSAGLKARKVLRNRLKGKLITEYVLPYDKKDINDLSKEEFENLKEIF